MKPPTPNPIAPMSNHLGIDGTWFAKTVKSGSATVINNPKRKKIKINRPMLCFLVKEEPTNSPILCIDVSAPTLNNHMPRMTKTAEMIKMTNWLIVRSKPNPGIK